MQQCASRDVWLVQQVPFLITQTAASKQCDAAVMVGFGVSALQGLSLSVS